MRRQWVDGLRSIRQTGSRGLVYPVRESRFLTAVPELTGPCGQRLAKAIT